MNLKLSDARMRFRVAIGTVPEIRSNFPGKYRKESKPLTCPSCVTVAVPGPDTMTVQPPLHTQTHILYECEEFRDLQQECDPEDDQSLAVFFRKVVARRLELDEDYLDSVT